MVKKKDYPKVTYEGKQIRKHRLVWYQEYGYWPFMVDHIDGDINNNDISNLREVTKIQNGYNRKKDSTNTSGYKGVFKNNVGFFARIVADKKKHYLGNFKTPEEAALAYNEAAKKLHKEYAKLNKVSLKTLEKMYS